jgi:hypothetical protein
MSIELRKYIKQATQHPLAPFHVIVRADSAATARALLEQALEDLGIKLPKAAEAKEEAKPPAKVIRNPKHCSLVKTLSATPGKRYYYVECDANPDGWLAPVGLVDSDTDVRECYECKKFKPKEGVRGGA